MLGAASCRQGSAPVACCGVAASTALQTECAVQGHALHMKPHARLLAICFPLPLVLLLLAGSQAAAAAAAAHYGVRVGGRAGELNAMLLQSRECLGLFGRFREA